jgi:hypothetical protein
MHMADNGADCELDDGLDDNLDDATLLSAETTRLSAETTRLIVADDTVRDITTLSDDQTRIAAGDDTVIIEESTVIVGAPAGTAQPVDDLTDVRVVPRISTAPDPETCARLREPGGQEFTLHRPIVLGRAPRTPLGPHERVLLLSWPGDDREVSASHLMLEQTGAGVVITDLGSANGTRVRVPGQTPRRLGPRETFTTTGEATVEFGHSGRIMVIPARSHSQI